MKQLTPEGQKIIDDIAGRHHFSSDAVFSMLQSIIDGNGSMAQFNHSEFGGYGQWMRGGMLMVGDMFNNTLKSRVSSLCEELANLISQHPGLIQTGNFQSQSQGGGGLQQGSYGGQQQSGNSSVSLFVPHQSGGSRNWWPADLQFPSSTGSQNNARYAYFADQHRLAIDINGHVTVYDTQDHQIGGFAQQQSVGGSLTFTSQYGLVDVNSLPVVNSDKENEHSVNSQAKPDQSSPASSISDFQQTDDVFAAIEKLATLKEKGILTEAEYATKKQELLSRL
jgi:hypothetical protein